MSIKTNVCDDSTWGDIAGVAYRELSDKPVSGQLFSGLIPKGLTS